MLHKWNLVCKIEKSRGSLNCTSLPSLFPTKDRDPGYTACYTKAWVPLAISLSLSLQTYVELTGKYMICNASRIRAGSLNVEKLQKTVASKKCLNFHRQWMDSKILFIEIFSGIYRPILVPRSIDLERGFFY